MNREQKLALIVGFSVVLLVGILLTDHLSQARTVRMDGIARGEGSLPSLANPSPRSAYAQDPKPTITEVTLGNESASTTGEIGQGQPVALNQDPLSPDMPIGNPLEDISIDPAHTIVASDNPATPSAVELAQASEHAQNGASTGTPAELTMGLQTQATPAIIDPLESKTPDPAWYTVKPNESLYVISKRFYGKGTLWRKLAAHNVGRVGEDGTIRTGVRLQIPHPSVVIGPGATYANAPEQPAAKTTKPTPTTTLAKVETRSYTIQPNDCLSKIAQNELGTIRRQNEILALNAGKLTDADDIRSGMVIQLPAS